MLPILAVDPGKMTGWATYSCGRAVFGEDQFMEFHRRAEAYLLRVPCRVICERFVIGGGTVRVARGDTNWSIETIGVLRYLCDREGAPFELQGAADAKRFGTDSLLRRLRWWTPGSDHARDAARHLALTLARHHPSELDRLLLECA